MSLPHYATTYENRVCTARSTRSERGTEIYPRTPQDFPDFSPYNCHCFFYLYCPCWQPTNLQPSRHPSPVLFLYVFLNLVLTRNSYNLADSGDTYRPVSHWPPLFSFRPACATLAMSTGQCRVKRCLRSVLFPVEPGHNITTVVFIYQLA